jgi:predicted XRE-type DNA-binding protein
MGRERHLSSDLPRQVGGQGGGAARVQEENAGYIAQGRGARQGKIQKGRGLAYDEATGNTYASVFHALEDDPVVATNLLMRSDLMTALTNRIREWGGTQQEAALRLGITQPRLNLLLKRRINEFSLDALIALLEPAGLEIEFSVKAA